jgi:hypothetical protein
MQRYRFERHNRATELAPSRNFDDEDDTTLPPEHADDFDDSSFDEDEEGDSNRKNISSRVAHSPSCTALPNGSVRLLLVAHSDAVRESMRVIFPQCKSTSTSTLKSFGRVEFSPKEPDSPLFELAPGVVLLSVAHAVSRDDAFAFVNVVCASLSPQRVCVVDGVSFDDRAAALLRARDRSELFFVETPAHKALIERPDLANRAKLLDSFVLSGFGAAFVSHCALRNLPALVLAVDAAADGDTSDALVNALHVLASIVPTNTIDVARAAKQLAKPTPVHNALFL